METVVIKTKRINPEIRKKRAFLFFQSFFIESFFMKIQDISDLFYMFSMQAASPVSKWIVSLCRVQFPTGPCAYLRCMLNPAHSESGPYR